MLFRYNKNCDDKVKMGVANKTELERRQQQFMAQIMRTIARQGINSLRKMFIEEKDHSPAQDVFRAILCTPYMEKVSQGMLFSHEWADAVWLNPLVQAMVALKFHFENLNEVTNVNLATELSDILQLPPTSSIQAIVQRLEKVLDPVAKAYTTVPELLAYLKGSVQYEIIRRRARKDSGDGTAWKQAYNRLREVLTSGGKLLPDTIAQAIDLAEAHLREQEIEEIDSPVVRRAKAATGSEQPAAAQDDAKVAKAAKRKRQKVSVKKLRVQLADYKSGKTNSAPPRPVKPQCKAC